MKDKDYYVGKDKAHLIHPLTMPRVHREKGPRIITEGDGVMIRDIDGRTYIDGFSGLWCVTAGHGRPEITEAVRDQMERLAYHTSFFGIATPPSIELADRVIGLFPSSFGLGRVLFTCGGSETNETNIKFARLYHALQDRPEKHKIISLHYSYHGLSLGALSATGIFPFQWMFEPLTPGFVNMPAPYCYQCELDLEYPGCDVKCARMLEEIIEEEGAGTVAAFIAEPVIGSGGIIIPPKEYWPAVRSICDSHDVLVIMDEVVTGFGRLGEWFASTLFDVRPDMVSLAKGISSGYLPLGATVMSDRIYDLIAEKLPDDLPIMHGFTYNNHPVCCAAALANIRLIEDEGLIENARKMGAYLLERLEGLCKYRSVGDVRGLGLMAAVELVADKAARTQIEPPHAAPTAVCEKAWEMGLYVRPMMEVVGMAPPLTIDRATIDKMVDILEASIREMEKQFFA